jgi:TPR repeat protein
MPLGCRKESAIAEQKPSYEKTISVATGFFNSGRLAEAYLTASAAITLDDKRWQAYALTGLVLITKGATNEAVSFVEKALARAPEEKRAKLQEMIKRLRPAGEKSIATTHSGRFANEANQVESDLDSVLGTTATSSNKRVNELNGAPQKRDKAVDDVMKDLDGTASARPGTTSTIPELQAKAEAGDATAQLNLGIAYYKGQGVEKNAPEAIRWLHKAAQAGKSDAQCLLGFSYMLGQGVTQDRTEGLKWLRKAAELGDASAMKFLNDPDNVSK